MTNHNTQEKRRSAYNLGLAAEQAAVDYLVSLGYAIRERRWKPTTGKGEIDIIAMAGSIMVFAEVKCRTLSPLNDPDAALLAVNALKRRNMVLGADKYLAIQPVWYQYRFDIITVTIDSSASEPNTYKVSHITDAFLSPVFTRR